MIERVFNGDPWRHVEVWREMYSHIAVCEGDVEEIEGIFLTGMKMRSFYQWKKEDF